MSQPAFQICREGPEEAQYYYRLIQETTRDYCVAKKQFEHYQSLREKMTKDALLLGDDVRSWFIDEENMIYAMSSLLDCLDRSFRHMQDKS